MKTYIGNIYQCEFCGKKSAWKHVITNHEKICKSKPDNKHKCFQYCQHLEKITGGILKHHYEDLMVEFDYEETEKYEFRCAISKKLMYSYKLERQNIKNEERISKLERMPLKCKDFECTGGNSGDYIPSTQ